MPDHQPPTVSVAEAARLLGVGQASLRSEINKRGTVAGVRVIRVGRLIRVPTAPLRRLLDGEPA